MSGWASVLGNVASGGLLGLLGQVATGFMHAYQVREETKAQVMLLEAQQRVATEQAAGVAFAASQQAETATQTNVSPWAANIKTLWRPALTLLLLALSTVIYFQSPEVTRADIAGNIVTATTACIFWWFGSRYQTQLRNAAPTSTPRK